jgi:thiosulfate reductase cytochrome b subunit
MGIEAARDPAARGTSETADGARVGRPQRRLIGRHSVIVRATHWINVVCLIVLLMSGLQIFNAHPALYWGEISDFGRPFFAITAKKGEGGAPRGVAVLAGRELDTTGVLGFSRNGAGRTERRAFPAWATLPSWQSLAEGRLWHFFFAWVFVLNGLVYLLHGLTSRHLWRDMVPSWTELGRIGRTAFDHLRLRFPKGEEASRYNVLQKLSYLSIIFVVLPMLVLTGLAMAPRLDAAFPWLTSLWDGRQSARTIHFIAALALVLFVLVHVFMVLVSGLWNNMRAMVTGRYTIETSRSDG